MRNLQKLKTLEDFRVLDHPIQFDISNPLPCPFQEQHNLRVLVRPKYSNSFIIPESLKWLENTIISLSCLDRKIAKIEHSWVYVTVRHGVVKSEKDDEWHFDGASFRTDTIPERNYFWCDHTPTQYKTGNIEFPSDFDPMQHDISKYASEQLKDVPIKFCNPQKWYLLLPFCLHRRNPETINATRTFIRISFIDVEIRDINNTKNPLIATPAFGRDSVQTFRNRLKVYGIIRNGY